MMSAAVESLTNTPLRTTKLKVFTFATVILGIIGLGISFWSLINANQKFYILNRAVYAGPSPEQINVILSVASFVGILTSLSAFFLVAPGVWSLQPKADLFPALLTIGFSFLSSAYGSIHNLDASPYELRILLDVLTIVAAIHATTAYFLLRKDVARASLIRTLTVETKAEKTVDETGKRVLQSLETLGDGWFSSEDIAIGMNQNTLKSWDVQALEKLLALGVVERDEDEDQPGQWLYHLVKSEDTIE